MERGHFFLLGSVFRGYYMSFAWFFLVFFLVFFLYECKVWMAMTILPNESRGTRSYTGYAGYRADTQRGATRGVSITYLLSWTLRRSEPEYIIHRSPKQPVRRRWRKRGCGRSSSRLTEAFR